MRDQLNYEELEAMRILDAVKAGIDIAQETINWALWVTGDLVGLR
jgi:predicted DNA-binding protein (UPF0251 family)